jgi:hypothetical protein
MYNWAIQTTPLINTHAESNCFCGNCEHSWIVADEDDATRGRNSGFDHSNDIGNRETVEQGPHGKVLEPGRRRRKLITQCIILHINAYQIIESWRWETEYAGNLLCMKKIGSFVPVDPHASQVVTQEVVERVSGQEA